MRGKVLPDRGRVLGVGITPAYAGKSFLRSFSQSRSGDHPRVCGEKLIKGLVHPIWMGSPPRMRGKAPAPRSSFRGSRITPACAGKSSVRQRVLLSLWDHPACAGKRQALAKALSRSRDHPRMCGEKESARPARPAAWGSPPRMRGKVKSLGFRCLLNGITPAYAGKRLKRSRSTVSPVAIVPLFPSVCNKPVVSDGSPAGRDAPLFLPAENAVPASPAYNLRSL